MYLQLLNAATATNSAPSGDTAGFALDRGGNAGKPTQGGHRDDLESCVILVKSTAGSDTMTVTCKLWGYDETAAAWFPLGPHATAATKGVLNLGNALEETGANVIAHAEMVGNLNNFSRVYLEITAIGGTDTAISAWLVSR